MIRWCYRLFAVAALALAAWGGYLVLFPRADGPARTSVEVDRADRDLGTTPVGKQSLVFRLTNCTDRTLKLSGPPWG